LKRDVLREYNDYEPDTLLIEKKASGAPLIYDLRAMGVPVSEYTPSKGQDKIARLNSVSDMIASGKVWVPKTRWAEELVDEIAAFPSGEHDDLVDSTTLALMRFRQGGFLRLPIDEPEDIKWFQGHRKERFYTV
jgi:predicted phage terminase large subunit-like protein